MAGFFILLAAGLIIGIGVYFSIYTKKDHWPPKTGETLLPDAEVVGFDTKRFNKYSFKTKVSFSDGFTFTSFDTRSEFAGVLTAGIVVDVEMKKRIPEKAIQKHQALLGISDTGEAPHS